MSTCYLSKVFIGKDVENRLLQACQRGDISTVNKALRLHVSPNVKDEFGVSAISKACAGGHTEVVRMLLEAGADPNVKQSGNVTPIHVAAKGKHNEIIKHLILNKASLEPCTSSGLKPLDFIPHESELWFIFTDALKGEMPELEEILDVPDIPEYSLPDGAAPKKGKKKGKKGGKKGKKGGKKKGGKKKGGKKKKKK